MRRAACSVAAAAVAHSLHSTDSQVEAQELHDVAHSVFQPEDVSARPLLRVSSDPNLNASLLTLGVRLAANPKIQQLVAEEMEGWMIVEAPGGAAFPVLKDSRTSITTPHLALPQPDDAGGERKAELEGSGGRSSLPLSASAPSALNSLAGPLSVALDDGEEEAEPVTPRGEDDDGRSSAVIPAPPPPSGFAGVVDWLQQKINAILALFSSASPASPVESPSAAPALAEAKATVETQSSSSSSASSPSAVPVVRSAPAAPLLSTGAIVNAALGLAGVLLMLVAVRRFDPKLFSQLLR